MSKFDACLMNIAHEYARMSRARRLRVGAVIAKEGRVISGGYNGTPSGYSNECDLLDYLHCTECCASPFLGPIKKRPSEFFDYSYNQSLEDVKVFSPVPGNDNIKRISFTCHRCKTSNYFQYDKETDTVESNMKVSYVTSSEVIHAEQNAILFAAKEGVSTKGCSLYVTHSPCYDCAKMIIQAGIVEVVYDDEYRDTRSLEFLERCGIKVRKVGE